MFSIIRILKMFSIIQSIPVSFLSELSIFVISSVTLLQNIYLLTWVTYFRRKMLFFPIPSPLSTPQFATPLTKPHYKILFNLVQFRT